MVLRLALCALFSLYNTYTDVKSYKIRNPAVAAFSCLALLLAAASGGIKNVCNSLLGGALSLLLFPLFALHMLGAGDVKALMAIGFMLGFPAIVPALTYSILCNGVIATALLILRKNGRERLRKLGAYLKACFLLRSPPPYAIEKDNGSYRFSIGILAGILLLLARAILEGR